MNDKKRKALNVLEKLVPKMSDYTLDMFICFGEGMVVKANEVKKEENKTSEVVAV